MQDRAYMRSITMRIHLAAPLALLAALATAGQAHAQHRVSFASEPESLHVFIDSTQTCQTPCEQALAPGRYHLGFAQEHDEETDRRSEHARHPHRVYQEHEFGWIDVQRAIDLRVRWIDRGDLRLAGDIVLIVGVTIGALLAGTIFASYNGDDDSLLAAGSSGVVLAGLSLAIGIPLSLYDDTVRAVH